MAEIYAEFGIEVFDKSIVNECFDILQKLGDTKKIETRRKTITIDYCTPSSNVNELETTSDYLCNILEPYKNEIKSFISKNSDKLYADVCFVKTSNDDDLVIKLNKRIIELVNTLGVEISFDGI